MKTLPKTNLATLNASTGNLPRGGRRPWTVVQGYPECAVKDADGRTLFVSSPAVCNMTANAVNAFPKTCADLLAMETTLRALREKLRTFPRTPAVAELLAIVDVGLCDTDEFEASETP